MELPWSVDITTFVINDILILADAIEKKKSILPYNITHYS